MGSSRSCFEAVLPLFGLLYMGALVAGAALLGRRLFPRPGSPVGELMLHLFVPLFIVMLPHFGILYYIVSKQNKHQADNGEEK
ncbi:MAG: hypothetical protein JWQ02_949 [Capsulimonas sp.]|nr:hypothetical protein [Capsulimonas sp.]